MITYNSCIGNIYRTLGSNIHLYIKKEEYILSLFSFFQTNLAEIILLVALIPGCEIVWRAEKTSLFIVSGTRGRGVPVETSHNNYTF